MATTAASNGYMFDFGSAFTLSPAPGTAIPSPTGTGTRSPAMSTTKAVPRKIQRNRASYSCHSCRRRKVKCDRTHPTCGNCSKTGELCTYSDNTGKDSKGRKSGSSGSSSSNNTSGNGISSSQNVTSAGSGSGAASAAGSGVTKRESQKKRRRTLSGPPQVPDEDEDDSDAYSAPSATASGPSRTGSMQLDPSGSSSTASLADQLPLSYDGRTAAFPTPPPPPPGLLSGVLKEGELETRVNRLAEIVDRWYRDAYSHGVSVSPAAISRGAASGEVTPVVPLSALDQKDRTTSSSSLQSQWGATSGSGGRLQSHMRTASGTDLSSRRGAQPVYLKKEPWAEGPFQMPGGPDEQIGGRMGLGLTSVNVGAKEGDVDELALGHLSIQDGGRSRYVGSSFWALLSNEISELNTVLKHSETPGEERMSSILKPSSNSIMPDGLSTPSPSTHPPSPETTSSTPLYRLAQAVDKTALLHFESTPTASTTGLSLREIMHTLPPQHVCNALYQSFLVGVHPVMPLLHAPTFANEYRSFWAWYPEHAHMLPSSDLVENPTFLPLLFAVLYAGAMSMSAKQFGAGGALAVDGRARSKDAVTAHLYAATTAALQATAFPRCPSISSLTAFLIVQTCLIREEEPLTSCSFVGTAMRVAMSMGLHRDGSLYGLSPIECEVRRRVWWHIMYLDVQGAIATGLPPLGPSADDLFDTKMVSELKDEYIGVHFDAQSRSTTPPTETSSTTSTTGSNPDTMVSPAMILAVGRYECTLLMRKIICRLFGIRPAKRNDLVEMSEMIYQLKVAFEDKIARIPVTGLGVYSEDSPEGREVVFNSWARIMLCMLADRAYAVLYQPFLKSTKSKLWLHARTCALHASHAFLRNFIHLSRSPQFQPYQWFCPGTYQPLHATMILLLDLYERPLAPEAARSRCFVDEIFSLFGDPQPDSFCSNPSSINPEDSGSHHPRPLLEGGREAWRMLGRLRARAYDRAAAVDIEEGIRAQQQQAAAQAQAQAHAHAQVQAQQQQMRSQQQQGFEMAYAIPPHLSTHTAHFDEMHGEMAFAPVGMDGIEMNPVMAGMQMDGVEMHTGMGGGMGNGVKAEGIHGQHAHPGHGLHMQDFDWEEWDTVFGKFVQVDDGSATSAASGASPSGSTCSWSVGGGVHA